MSEPESQSSGIAMSGLEKASVLLIALGADVSSSVLQQLSPDEIERVTSEIVQRKRLDPELRRQVVDECRRALCEDVAAGGADYARKLLEQGVGAAKARELLSRVSAGGGVGAFRWLRAIPPRQIASSIQEERAQIIALVLGHLSPEHAAQVLSALPESVQGEVALRLTTMQPTDPDVIRNLDGVLLQRLATADNSTFTEVGGTDTVIQILNNVDRSTEKKIMEYLTGTDEAVANRIKEGMFIFDDLPGLDDRFIQTILRDVPQDDLRLALKGCAEEVREVFYRNMSQRAAETLKEDLEASGPVRLRDIEGAQNRIAAAARQLDEAGEITLRGEGEDMMI